MATTDAVSASAQGAKYLVLLQIGSRAVTFCVNQVLLRFLSPTLLGVAVQLELYIISTLYFARESLRVATQRRAVGGVQAAVNLSYISLALGPPLAFFFAQLYLQHGLPDVPYAREALFVNAAAAMIELCSEPAFVAVQQMLLFKIRATAEARAVVVKTLTTAGLVFFAHARGLDLGVLPFAAGELAHSTAMSIVFIYRTSQANEFSLLPMKLQPRCVTSVLISATPKLSLFSFVPTPLLVLGMSLYVQTGIKWVLTEGDKMLIATLTTLEEQGMYAVSANYGGLIARMLFRPVEESCRSLFGALCAPAPTANIGLNQSKGSEKQPTNTENLKVLKEEVTHAASILTDILRIYAISAYVIFVLGPFGAPLLLELVAGSRWAASGAGAVLGVYSLYVPLMALNGVSEAFVAATATTRDLGRQSVWMTCLSVVFAASAWVLVRVYGLGASGLVYANCINMILRILFNVRYIKTFFRKHDTVFNISHIIPETYTGAVAIATNAVLIRTKNIALLQSYGLLGGLLRVAGIGVVYLAAVALSERKFLLGCYGRYRNGIDKK